MPIEVEQLRFFIEVASAGSVNKAAKAAHIAQSALSRRIQRLENDLGVMLFMRSQGGVVLTAAGHKLLREAEPIVHAVQSIEDSARKARSGAALALGLTASSALLLEHVVTRFRQRYPGTHLQAVQGTTPRLEEWLMAGDLHLAVMTNPRPNKRLHIRPLWSEDLFVIGSPAFCRDGSLSLAALSQLPFILTSRSPGVHDTINAAFQRLGFQLQIGIEMETTATVKRLVHAREAFTVLPFSSCADDVKSGRFAAARLCDAQIRHCLARRNDQPVRKEATHLGALLVEVAKSTLPKTESALAAGSLETVLA